MKEIRYINVDRLFAHPGNPRKDMGDIEDLARSVAESGVLQNLTVVKKEVFTNEDKAEIYERTKGEASAEAQKKKTDDIKGDAYTVVIGHRRLMAARMAGLLSVPCVIEDMDEKTQQATMIAENVQRKTLSLYEEIRGVQMCLDLGMDEGEIAKKTGMGKAAVERRRKAAAVGVSEEAIEKGATLSDYLEVEALKSAERKQEALKVIGTNNFRWKIDTLKRAELKEEKDAFYRAKLTERGWTEVEGKRDGLIWHGYLDGDMNTIDDRAAAAEAEGAGYFAITSYGVIAYREKTEEEKTANDGAEEKEADRKRRVEEHGKLVKNMRRLIAKTITGMTEEEAEKHKNVIAGMIEYYAKHGDFDEDTWDDIMEVAEEPKEGQIWRRLLYIALCYSLYEVEGLIDWYGRYREPGDMMQYAISAYRALGYVYSDEEKKLLDGRHEVYLIDN